MNNPLAQRLAAARQAIHPKITQRDVAIRLNRSPSAVNLWEKGKTEPNNDDLVTLSRWFGVSTDWLLGVDTEHTLEGANTSAIKTTQSLYTVPVVSPSSLVRWHWDTVLGLLQTAVSYPSKTAAGVLIFSDALHSICPLGSYAVVSKAHDIHPGHVVLASVSKTGEPVLRKLIKEGGDSILVADDTRYPTYRVDDNVRLIARVTEVVTRRML